MSTMSVQLIIAACVAIVLVTALYVSLVAFTKKPKFRLVFKSANSSIKEKYLMHKISFLVTSFIVTAIGLAASGTASLVDGVITAVSSDPNVLSISDMGDGKFQATVVGVGKASITISADADLGDGVREVTQVVEFEVYDPSTEVTHFDVTISDVVQPAAAA